jgi:hypothetical protein
VGSGLLMCWGFRLKIGELPNIFRNIYAEP